MYFVKLFGPILILLLTNCNTKNSEKPNDKNTVGFIKPIEKVEIKYSFFTLKEGRKDSLEKRFTPDQISIILAINRIDIEHLSSIDTLIIPDNFRAQLIQYSPFPISLLFLKDIKKIIFFSYSTQSFATYNSGILTHWGPTNMGSKKYPTPTGIYYANWKAEETISTFNDEWVLKWNVNLENKEGIGWHQYTMPGYPVSHSCLRLLDADAKYLYDWVDEWILMDKENILTKGTPTIVFGVYPSDGRKPWTALVQNSHRLDLSEVEISAQVKIHLPEIRIWELKRDSITKVIINQ